MNPFAAVFAICCLATAQARPGYHGGGGEYQLQGIPDAGAYSKTHYPHYDLIELGEFSKGSLPPTTIVSEKHITIKVPEPYPVKVPHPVHIPVPVAKPYPVYQTKIVKVPHPVPYEVVKKVPIPIEVPKPYPVPAHEHHGGGGSEGTYGGSFEGGFGGAHSIGESYGGGDDHYGGGQVSSYEGGSSYGGGEHGESDQSGGYAAYEQPQEGHGIDQSGGVISEQNEGEH